MMKGTRMLGWACTAALALACTGVAYGQEDKTEKPVLYTYVAEWSAPRAQWGDIEKGDSGEKAAVDKMLADGTIVAAGQFKTIVHQEGGATHGSWFQATSMANLLKALDAVVATGRANAPVYAASKHWDYILESRQYNGKVGSYDKAYLRVSTWTAKPGSGDTVERFEKNFMVPLLDKLVADGSVAWYQIDEEAIHTSTPGMIDLAIVTPDAAGLDAYYAALEQAEKKDGFAGEAFDQAVDEAGHRDSLAVASFVKK